MPEAHANNLMPEMQGLAGFSKSKQPGLQISSDSRFNAVEQINPASNTAPDSAHCATKRVGLLIMQRSDRTMAWTRFVSQQSMR
jgi:hypothetical protein